MKPELIVPDPIVDGVSVVTYDEESEVVTMPLWYWKKIVIYIADTQIWYLSD